MYQKHREQPLNVQCVRLFFHLVFSFFSFFVSPDDWGCKKACWKMCVFYATELHISDRRNNSKPVKYHAFPFIYGSMMLSSLLRGKLNAGQRYSYHIFHNATNSQTAIVHCSCCFGLFNISNWFHEKAYLEHVPTKITDLFLRYFPCVRRIASKFHIGLLLFDFKLCYILYPGVQWKLVAFLTLLADQFSNIICTQFFRLLKIDSNRKMFEVMRIGGKSRLNRGS